MQNLQFSFVWSRVRSDACFSAMMKNCGTEVLGVLDGGLDKAGHGGVRLYILRVELHCVNVVVF